MYACRFARSSSVRKHDHHHSAYRSSPRHHHRQTTSNAQNRRPASRQHNKAGAARQAKQRVEARGARHVLLGAGPSGREMPQWPTTPESARLLKQIQQGKADVAVHLTPSLLAPPSIFANLVRRRDAVRICAAAAHKRGMIRTHRAQRRKTERLIQIPLRKAQKRKTRGKRLRK